MISLSLLFVTYLQPEIAAVKQLIPQGNEVDLERFSLFHMISKNTYMIVSLLGLALVVSSDKVEN